MPDLPPPPDQRPEMKVIGIRFGALCPPLAEQLQLPRRRLRYLQECADGITALAVGELLTAAEVRRARRRLLKRILKTFAKELRRRGTLMPDQRPERTR